MECISYGQFHFICILLDLILIELFARSYLLFLCLVQARSKILKISEILLTSSLSLCLCAQDHKQECTFRSPYATH